MVEVGEILRQERLRKNVSLDSIASETRISPRFLVAIESGNFTELPGLVFTRNFIRQYAITLELDPEPIVAALPKVDETQVQLPNPPIRAASRSSFGESWLSPTAVSLLWFTLAVGAGAAAYYHFSARNPSPTVVAAPAKPAPSVVARPAAPVAVPVAAPSEPVNLPATAAADGPAAPALDTYRPVQVRVRASAAAWVQMVADGKTAFIGTLQPNETKDVSADQNVRIVAGNAGGIVISLNGKTLEPIGPPGQVRTVRLTAEGPQLLSKPQPVAPDPL